MNSIRLKTMVTGIGLWVFFFCHASAATAGGITAQELEDRIELAQPPFILDVRSKEEYAAGHIPGAINIPVTELAASSSKLARYKDQEIIVYCQYGPRASFAKFIMLQNGFKKITDLQGHMHKWQSEGHPLEKP